MKAKVIVKREALLEILAKRNMSLSSLARAIRHEESCKHLCNRSRKGQGVGPLIRKKILRELKVGFDQIFEIKLKE